MGAEVRSPGCAAALAFTHLCEQAQDLQVHPDQCDHDAKRAVPFHEDLALPPQTVAQSGRSKGTNFVIVVASPEKRAGNKRVI